MKKCTLEMRILRDLTRCLSKREKDCDIRLMANQVLLALKKEPLGSNGNLVCKNCNACVARRSRSFQFSEQQSSGVLSVAESTRRPEGAPAPWIHSADETQQSNASVTLESGGETPSPPA